MIELPVYLLKRDLHLCKELRGFRIAESLVFGGAIHGAGELLFLGFVGQRIPDGRWKGVFRLRIVEGSDNEIACVPWPKGWTTVIESEDGNGV